MADNVSQFISNVDSILTDIDSKLTVINSKGIEIKTFDTLKNDNLTKSYSEVVDDLSVVTQLIQKVVAVNINIRKAKDLLMDLTVPPSLVSQYRVRLDNLSRDSKDLKEVLFVAKDTLQSKVRFYQTTSYSLDMSYKL